MPTQKWSRRETLAAFALYCRTPFGRLHARNQDIIALAARLGRTASAVAMKCCNLASLDDTHQARGVKGLRKVSAVDRSLWADFQTDPEAISFEAAKVLAAVESRPVVPPLHEPEIAQLEGKERERVTRIRVNQYFFRDLVLASYNESCAVCTLPIRQLLVGAHIVPWSSDSSLRMKPRNGICLCGTHDLAFERGLLRVQSDLVIRISIPDESRDSPPVNDWLIRYEGGKIHLPHRWCPDSKLLARKLTLLIDDSK
ncbi:MAG: HNH endonuclease [Gemmataceae bacterium]